MGDYVGEGGGGGRRIGGKRATTSVKTMPPASGSQHGARSREGEAAEAASHQSNLPVEAQGAVAHVRRPVDIDLGLNSYVLKPASFNNQF